MSYILDALRRAEAERRGRAQASRHDDPLTQSPDDDNNGKRSTRPRIVIGLLTIAVLGAVIWYAFEEKPPALSGSVAGKMASSTAPGGAVAPQTTPAPTAPPLASTDRHLGTPALTVTTERPRLSSLGLRLTANGNIAPWQEASIGTEANSLRVAEVRVNVGDVVKRGDVLATFAADTVRADVAQTRASVIEAEANAADASANAQRARSLQASGALSEVQINQYVTAEATAKARLQAQRAAASMQELRLAQTRVLAPDDGVISARSATVGAVLPAGQELFRMIRRQGRLEWRAEVTATDLGRIQPGVAVTVVGNNGAAVTGRVRMIAPTVDPQTRIGLVYVDLPTEAAQAAALKAGMFAKGEFNLGSRDALTVPQQAVVVRDGFAYVFRLNADGRVTQIKVETGRRNGERIELLAGVTPEMPLVVSGTGFLNDGDLVHAVAASPASASAPNPAS